jgi:UV DNA damage endonuclease
MKELIFVENCDPLFQQIRLGLCCMNSELRTKNIFCSRTITRKNFTVEKAQQLALKNISDIKPLLEWNIRNDINVFRLSSDIFPHFTDSETEKYEMDFSIPLLRDCGEFCNENLQRITMHPGQFNQVGARDRGIFEKTIEDLSMHCEVRYMGIRKKQREDGSNNLVNYPKK